MAYRSTKFIDVLNGVFGLGGLGAAAGDADARSQALGFINLRVREAVETEFWAELCPAEKRAYRPAYDAGTTYAAGEEIFFTDSTGCEAYYTANSSPNTPAAGESPEDEPTKWTVLTDFRRTIALDQEGKTPIGEVYALTVGDPVKNPKSPRVPFTLTSEGIVPRNYTRATVWVQFRIRPPQFTLEPWSSEETYYKDDTVFDEQSGECYRALQTTTGDGVGALIYWQKILFPYVVETFVKRAAYADMLPADGEEASAGRALGRAYKALTDASDNATLSQSQSDRAGVCTY